MNCMRCGRIIALGQAFCKDCLTDMEQHPVKPGTPIQIPTQPTAAVLRPVPVRKVRKPEEQIARLRKLLLFQSGALLLLAVGLTISLVLLFTQTKIPNELPLPGQNYSTIPSTQGTTEPTITTTEIPDVSRETFFTQS